MAGGIWDVFACSAKTKAHKVKRMILLDSAHQKGLKMLFHRVLTLDGDGFWQG